MSDIAHVVVGHLKNKQRLGRHAVQNKILAPPHEVNAALLARFNPT
jgi:hypothetical protein